MRCDCGVLVHGSDGSPLRAGGVALPNTKSLFFNPSVAHENIPENENPCDADSSF